MTEMVEAQASVDSPGGVVSFDLRRFLDPLERQAEAYGRRAPTAEKLNDMMRPYDDGFHLHILKFGEGDADDAGN